jgi:hypothetical protein
MSYSTYELRNTLIPSLDDSSNTDLSLERRSPVSRRVELGSVEESSDVWHVSASRPIQLSTRGSNSQWIATVSPGLGKFWPSPAEIRSTVTPIFLAVVVKVR